MRDNLRRKRAKIMRKNPQIGEKYRVNAGKGGFMILQDEVLMPTLWEQWEDEPHKAFAAFTIYRDLPAAQRSLPNAYRIGMADPSKKKISGQWRHWSERYHWTERALAYDRHL